MWPFSSRKARPRTSDRRRRRSYRPRLEALESRDVPSVAGSLDPTFGAGGTVITDFGRSESGAAVALQPDGKIVVSGRVYDFELGTIALTVVRYQPDGSLDNSFGSSGRATLALGAPPAGNNIVLQSDGKILVAGSAFNGNTGHVDFAVTRLKTDGSLDASFGPGGTQLIDFGDRSTDPSFAFAFANADGIALQSDGRIVVSGTFLKGFDDDNADTNNNPFPVNVFAVARLNRDGSLDDGSPDDTTPGDSFGSGGKQTIEFNASDFPSISFGGSPSFGARAFGVAVQPDDRIVVTGGVDAIDYIYSGYPQASDFAVVRLDRNGSLDTSFNATGKQAIDFGPSSALGWVVAYGVAVQPDGKIITVGDSYEGAFAVSRLNGDGSLDASFNSTGKQVIDANSLGTAYGVAVQSDGKIVVAGTRSTWTADAGWGPNTFAVARLNGTGSLDTSFGAGGVQTTAFGTSDEGATGVALQPDGNMVVVGWCSPEVTGYDFALGRFLGNNDSDGVSDAVENGAPNGGDGNGDWILDNQQVNVTSLPNAVTGSYITLQSPAGTNLADVEAVTNPPPGLPAGAKTPVGIVDFQVLGVAPGVTTVVLYMPAGVKVNQYWKYGPSGWFNFTWDGTTGAKFQDVNGDRTKDIVLKIVDGGRGDNDGLTNGVVVDPGVPVFMTFQVQIDIKPGDSANSVNLASQGVIAVAIFSTADFNAAWVDVNSVLFAGATAVNYAWKDVNGDGRLDLVCNFRTQDTNLRALYEQLLADDIDADGVLDSNHQGLEVALTGRTTDDVLIEGVDHMDLFLSGKALRQILEDLAATGAI
jgi:uncharacterized delta-60 repeat protein